MTNNTGLINYLDKFSIELDSTINSIDEDIADVKRRLTELIYKLEDRVASLEKEVYELRVGIEKSTV